MARIVLLWTATGFAALAVAGSAPAKLVSGIQLCGPEACNSATDPETIGQFEAATGSDVSYTGPAAPGAYYILRLTSRAAAAETSESYYIPAARRLRDFSGRGFGIWRLAPRGERAVLDALSRGLQPYAMPKVTRATVGRKNASNPASYLSLYRLKATPRVYPKDRGWRRIRLHSASPSPWTDGASILRYQPTERVLDRDGEYVRLSKRLGRALQRAAALRFG